MACVVFDCVCVGLLLLLLLLLLVLSLKVEALLNIDFNVLLFLSDCCLFFSSNLLKVKEVEGVECVEEVLDFEGEDLPLIDDNVGEGVLTECDNISGEIHLLIELMDELFDRMVL
jgi:hypothetical protein